jgi:hypothetical protein
MGNVGTARLQISFDLGWISGVEGADGSPGSSLLGLRAKLTLIGLDQKYPLG